MNQSGQPEAHLSPDEIAEYLNGGSETERRRAEAHLGVCDECRQELLAVGRLVRARTRARSRRCLALVPVAAAAVLALLFVPGLFEEADGPRARAGDESGQRIEVLSPADGVSVTSDSIAFAWRPVAVGAQYSLHVTDEVGDVVLSEPTADTVLMIHAGLLRPGETYIWYLDALLPDGESATTGLRRFTIPP